MSFWNSITILHQLCHYLWISLLNLRGSGWTLDNLCRCIDAPKLFRRQQLTVSGCRLSPCLRRDHFKVNKIHHTQFQQFWSCASCCFAFVSVAQNINTIIITHSCTSERREAQPLVIIEEHIFWLDAFFPTRRLIRTLLGPQV